jgi:hypothetical protein
MKGLLISIGTSNCIFGFQTIYTHQHEPFPKVLIVIGFYTDHKRESLCWTTLDCVRNKFYSMGRLVDPREYDHNLRPVFSLLYDLAQTFKNLTNIIKSNIIRLSNTIRGIS